MVMYTDADVIRVIRENPRLFIRLLRQDEELLDEFRRVVLSDELLAMPAQLADVQSTQAAMLEDLASLRQTQNSMLETQAAMLETQAAMLEDLASLRQTQNSMLETQQGTSRDIKAMHGMYRRQHEDVERFRGNYAIDAARQNDMEIAELFARELSMGYIQTRLLIKDDLDSILNANLEAVVALHLRERAWRTFPNPDLIAEVLERRDANSGFYIVVEASYTGNAEDLLRATDHAKILRCATGQEAYAVVAGVRINPNIENSVFHDVAEFFAANDENAALWYQLGEEEMEPPDPC